MLASLKEGWKCVPNLGRRILRMIYGPTNGNGAWRTGYSNELYTLYIALDTVKVMRWLGQLFRMQELHRCRNRTVLKP